MEPAAGIKLSTNVQSVVRSRRNGMANVAWSRWTRRRFPSSRSSTTSTTRPNRASAKRSAVQMTRAPTSICPSAIATCEPPTASGTKCPIVDRRADQFVDATPNAHITRVRNRHVHTQNTHEQTFLSHLVPYFIYYSFVQPTPLVYLQTPLVKI